MLDPYLIGPRTIVATPGNAVWKTDRVSGTWRAAWRKNFDPTIGEGAQGHAFMTLGLPATSVYGRGEAWNNNWRHLEGARFQQGDQVSYAMRGLPVDIADTSPLSVTPPSRLPMLGEG
jgi:hypothetical protein